MASQQQIYVYEPVSNFYYIRSKLKPNHVLEIQKGYHEARTYITVSECKGPQAWHQHWYLEKAGDGFVYIISRLNGLVLDIKGASQSVGAYIITFPRNSPPEPLANQRWKLSEGNSLIASQLHGQVLSIRYESVKAGEYVVTNNVKTGEANYQRWDFVRVPVETPLGQSSDEIASDVPEGQRFNSSYNAYGGVSVEYGVQKAYARKRAVQSVGGQPKSS